MEALRTIASGTAVESPTPAADDLDYLSSSAAWRAP
jgi:hypothetical protein